MSDKRLPHSLIRTATHSSSGLPGNADWLKTGIDGHILMLAFPPNPLMPV